MTTHDYTTKLVKGSELTDEHVLVGESGGLSAVYEVNPGSLLPELVTVWTEHGALLLDPDNEYDVFDEEGS